MVDCGGGFRENIREFLRHCSDKKDYSIGTNSVWCTTFVSESNGVLFPLYVVEENVKDSSKPLCNHCRYAGWSHHFVCKRNYHLIIPEDGEWNKPLKEVALRSETNLLHAVIHCNGFGHLLCVDGVKRNSEYIFGEEIMDIWDYLCSVLQTREISVHNDVPQKGLLDLNLVQVIAHGRPWIGRWGYKFCHGCFGVSQQKYNRAIEIYSSLDLGKIVDDFTNTKKGALVKQVIQTYKYSNEKKLVTIRDLLKHMLLLKAKSPNPIKTSSVLGSTSSDSSLISPLHESEMYEPHADSNNNNQNASSSWHGDQQTINYLKYSNGCNSLNSFVAKLGTTSKWPARRLTHAVTVIFDILEEHGDKMHRQELRDSVREHIGDTGLIDFVVKNIDKVVLSNRIIHRTINPVSRLLEFALHDSSMRRQRIEAKPEPISDVPKLKPGKDVHDDLLFLYKNVLLGYPDCHPIGTATKTIMDSKHFVKRWHFGMNEEEGRSSVRLICQVRPSYDELVNRLKQPLSPTELVSVPKSVTISELKQIVQSAYRDTYCIMDKYVVSDVIFGELRRDKMQDMGMEVWVKGDGMDLSTRLRYQGGSDNWAVNCVCGARDDDGERMIACDVCRVWQHTRCSDIDDDEASPSVFLCSTCIARMKT